MNPIVNQCFKEAAFEYLGQHSFAALSTPLPAFYFGTRDYSQIRELQELAISHEQECVLLGEHLPILTLGKRLASSHREMNERDGELIPTCLTSRGGGISFHLPGQLVVYPVVAVRRRRIGVRTFIEEWGKALARLVERYVEGVYWSMSPPGMYVEQIEPGKIHPKIGAVGLEIRNGMTNHGFSINVSCSLDITKGTVMCGETDRSHTSVEAEVGLRLISCRDFAKQLCKDNDLIEV